MMRERKRVLLSWSSGKESAWALHLPRQQSDVELAGLLTTVNEQFDRMAMPAVRTDLPRRQAESVGLPLRLISLPFPCSNEAYEERLGAVIGPSTIGCDRRRRLRRSISG
jgi:diphthamide synthase (EF-2-diphthine--ammonia ligase)